MKSDIPKFGSREIIVFAVALLSGTASSLLSKVIISTKSRGMTGEEELFSSPIYQTLVMFLGMLTSLIVHSVVTIFKLPFPGYSVVNRVNMPIWMYFFLIFPSVCDLCSTALCMLGLRYVNVSIYQMMRGSCIIFVALLKQFVLKTKLKKFMWIGIFWNVVSIILVGASAMLAQRGSNISEDNSHAQQQPLLGILLIMLGAMIQSLQNAFEESVMSTNTVPAPPLFLVGMEGLWGIIICLFVLYPVAYICPGTDHNSYENPYNSLIMLLNSERIQLLSLCYFLSAFLYNVFGCLVTFMLDSVWHAILDNFRPITVWVSDLLIFYYISNCFGEPWTHYSFVQLLGLAVLIYGTAVYNAPNPGSIQLTGDCASLGIDCTAEYEDLDEWSDEFDNTESTADQVAKSVQLTRGRRASYSTSLRPIMSPHPSTFAVLHHKPHNTTHVGHVRYGSIALEMTAA